MEGFAISLAVVIVVIVTSFNDYMKDKQFKKLNAQTDVNMATVRRDGKESQIREQDLLVGDVVFLTAGDIVPADGIFAHGSRILVDESAITGESELVHKDAPVAGDFEVNPFLISGSKVSEGSGFMIVCAVGEYSVLGRTRRMMKQVEDEDTPLQEMLGVMAMQLGKLGMWAALLIFVISLIHIGVEVAITGEWGRDDFNEVISALIFSITVVVVAVPEGLPLAMTLSMAYSVFQMKDDKIFVRHLKGCEVMGAANNILSDKTGTLTQNKMKIQEAYLAGCTLDTLSTDLKKLIAEQISRNTTAFLNTNSKGDTDFIGNQTECALLLLIDTWGMHYQRYRTIEHQKTQFSFNSVTKMMTSIYEDSENLTKVYVKGAPEFVLERCVYYLNSDMRVLPFTDTEKARQADLVESMNSKGLRCLSFAYKVENLMGLEKIDYRRELVESSLIYLGSVGIEDPLRPEAARSVSRVQRAGVTVRMITGDSKDIAFKIAKDAGILDWNIDPAEIDSYVFEGRYLREVSGGLITEYDEDGKITGYKVGNLAAIKPILDSIRVVARCSPEDKLILVAALRETGKIVAVTGDGSNDAPALKQSDIGLAMMSGTKLCKEASDIILLDDNFESIVNSVKWGRNIYSSVRKFLQFQITINIVALVTSLIACTTVRDTPINAVQMLWINLIMDSFAALALATEPASEKCLETKPFGRDESILTYDMKLNIAVQSVYQIGVLISVLFLYPELAEIEPGWSSDSYRHYTFFFQTFVFLQLFNEINCRKLICSDVNVFSGFFNNWMFIGILLLTILVQVIIVQFGGGAFNCEALEWWEHLLAVALGAGGICLAIIMRLLVKRARQHTEKDEETKSLLNYEI
jgi:Ca2+ transporting ATPase